MAEIFTPWRAGALELPNRLVRSATWEGMAQDDGTPTHDTINLTAGLAEGGVGLIITGHTFVHPRGRAHPRQTGAHIDALVGPLARLADAVHKCGGKVAVQISHAGAQTRGSWIGAAPVGPSPLEHPLFKEPVEQLSREGIAEIVECFAAAAARVRAAGFDAVQLHAAHGYLLNQFLSPASNQREDDYGGPLENRARLLMEVYRAVRQAVGPGFPVLVKLTSGDCLEDGLGLEDCLEVARWLDREGIDAIEVSGGVAAAGKLAPIRVVKEPDDEGYFLEPAARIKAAVSCPVAVVGGFRSRQRAEAALERVDAVSLCRPFIRQPHLARLWREGSREPASCISCNQCLKLAMTQGVACGQELKKGEGQAG